VSPPVTIPRDLIVAKLRERDQNARADWVERDLPEQVDPHLHASLLSMLKLNVQELIDTPAE
jgi:hypothetical protein